MGLDGPKPNIFFGNVPSIITGKQPFVYDVDEIYRKYKTTHRAVGIFMSRNPRILILDPKLAQEVMVTKFGSYRGNLASDWIYDQKQEKYATRNPFMTTGDLWKNLRSEIVPGLTQSRLSLAFPIWKSCATKLGKLLKEITPLGHAIIETKHLAFCFTSNVLGEFIFGIETNSLTKPDELNPFLEMKHKWLKHICSSLDKYFKLLPFQWFRRFVQNRFFPAETDDFFAQLTKDAIEMRLKDNENSQDRVDFLNFMLQLQEKKSLTHDDIVGHILTTMLDGFETSASILSHTIFFLAHHPEYQEKLRMEILENIEQDGFMSYQRLYSLPYLDQCVNETIRLISVVNFYSRICTEPTELDLGNGELVPINVGQVVVVPVSSYHRDERYFVKPNEYNPERFNNQAHVELTKKGIFMPFGSGPRICFGMHLGMLQVKTCLVEILKSYRIKCCEQTIAEARPTSPTFIMGIDGEFLLEYERV
ncbi:probable cytochrome P450 309a1 isoform X2 [Eurosta solidaginis]|uniref:probable cytochrome P450 309a1 isoform X2 n=1 Tax=Eurosta solidaginis TaxID=178769 RepID=UPI003530FEA5